MKTSKMLLAGSVLSLIVGLAGCTNDGGDAKEPPLLAQGWDLDISIVGAGAVSATRRSEIVSPAEECKSTNAPCVITNDSGVMTVTLVATPAAGFVFDKWSTKGAADKACTIGDPKNPTHVQARPANLGFLLQTVECTAEFKLSGDPPPPADGPRKIERDKKDGILTLGVFKRPTGDETYFTARFGETVTPGTFETWRHTIGDCIVDVNTYGANPQGTFEARTAGTGTATSPSGTLTAQPPSYLAQAPGTLFAPQVQVELAFTGTPGQVPAFTARTWRPNVVLFNFPSGESFEADVSLDQTFPFTGGSGDMGGRAAVNMSQETPTGTVTAQCRAAAGQVVVQKQALALFQKNVPGFITWGNVYEQTIMASDYKVNIFMAGEVTMPDGGNASRQLILK